jgi:hypothetical protein
MITLPITEQAAKQEWSKIDTIACNNGYPEQIVYKLRSKLINNRNKQIETQPTPQHNKKWTTFTYHGPTVRKITNLFKHTNIQIAFRPANTIYQQLSQKPNNTNPSGIYQLKCNTCNNTYVGQSGRPIAVRYKEHIRYIRHNNPTLAYAMHILNNRHEFGPAEETMKLLKPCAKRTRMNCWEALFMHVYRRRNILIPEQQITDTNPLFDLAYTSRDS